jgi:cyanophycinase-like exopeptidase
VIGPVALHGGGEFLPGDDPFLDALLAAAAPRARGRSTRVAVVPTAAARGRPDLAAANGVKAFERVATATGRAVDAFEVRVVGHASAEDRGLASELAQADVIHLPGGDPDLIPTIMPGSNAWAAITDAHAGGAVLAGASAGAMALASWTWTPGGGMSGLRMVRGFAVVPHARAQTWEALVARFAAWAPDSLGALGLAERTGAIQEPLEPDATQVGWRVVGPGEAFWMAAAGAQTVTARSGDRLETPVIPL